MTRDRCRVYEADHPCFLTCTIVGWLPVFTRPERFQIVCDSWRWFCDRQRLKVFAYAIVENHLHLIASGRQLAKDMGMFKSYTARQIVDFLRAAGGRKLLSQFKWEKAAHKTDRACQVWQEGSHPEEIQSEEMTWEKIQYIHDNPVARSYVDDPLHWRHSSARSYAGEAGLCPLCTD
ncbi:MAG TPA: transposase [Thermoguttaceae bacterium]|nr:transposase [Thermoguttaceae bacterium]